ncbi:MAG: cytochrome D ubiquinol oxidase subunit I [Proteobacteria bacterium]|nr:cytochrome D ubiquinol oxidase subunit I [Pseudomonadota bacterium]MDE3208434.1 cytochrome D ubiquinol oxidase subunit I [Pseudomonadota bacterium]
MLDDMLQSIETIRERPVWQPIPSSEEALFHSDLPQLPEDIKTVHEQFMNHILPFGVGNIHPRFMGWVHGGGNMAGMMAEMLSAGLNANLGGRNQIPISVEQEVIDWMRQLFGFPDGSSGIFVTGSSLANLIGLWVARNTALGDSIRKNGVPAGKLTAYTSSAAHASIAQAFDLAGLGTHCLRTIPVNDLHQMDLTALQMAIDQDRKQHLKPFFIAATAGTVDVGAIDNLSALAQLARAEKLWLHVDGALGAITMLAPNLAPLLQGIEQADSLAFDLHKLGQVPYDAGIILVRNGRQHYETFASQASYLHREQQGVAGGTFWPCDYGPDLSRSFRALKAWFTFKVYGAKKMGDMIAHACALAQYMAACIRSQPDLELLAPVTLNIVCFRFCCTNPDEINTQIVLRLQESGIAVPSTTKIHGKLAIRAAITNHRTTSEDIDILIQSTQTLGHALCQDNQKKTPS